MLTSVFKIAEQVRSILDKGTIQSYIASVIDVYSGLVKREWYENKAVDCNELDGAFIVTFKDLEPILDLTVDQYYISIPSSYLRLPEESGIVFVGFAKGQDMPFVNTNAGTWARLMTIKAGVMGGNQLYYVEGPVDGGGRMYFPKMTNQTNGNIMLKLGVAFDSIDPDAEFNIPRSIISDVVNMVVQKYSPMPTEINSKID